MKIHESIKLNWKGKHAWNKWKVESFTEETEDAKTVQVKILGWENTIAKINTINTNKYNKYKQIQWIQINTRAKIKISVGVLNSITGRTEKGITELENIAIEKNKL